MINAGGLWITIPEIELRDLRDRLRRTRWPEKETVDDWSRGVPLAYVRELCEYWATEYDWRRTEARLNACHDWGTSISTSMAQQAPEHVVGIHLAPPLAAPDPDTFGELTDAEREALAALDS